VIPKRLKEVLARLNRVTVAGDIPAGVTGEHSYSIIGDASHYASIVDLASLGAWVRIGEAVAARR
jgi:hypothetical protein